MPAALTGQPAEVLVARAEGEGEGLTILRLGLKNACDKLLEPIEPGGDRGPGGGRGAPGAGHGKTPFRDADAV